MDCREDKSTPRVLRARRPGWHRSLNGFPKKYPIRPPLAAPKANPSDMAGPRTRANPKRRNVRPGRLAEPGERRRRRRLHASRLHSRRQSRDRCDSVLSSGWCLPAYLQSLTLYPPLPGTPGLSPQINGGPALRGHEAWGTYSWIPAPTSSLTLPAGIASSDRRALFPLNEPAMCGGTRSSNPAYVTPPVGCGNYSISDLLYFYQNGVWKNWMNYG
jgi:hypothetical protein